MSRGSRPPARCAVLLVAALVLAAEPALAHGNMAIGEFYSGALQSVLHLDALLPLLALAVWAAQLGEPSLWHVPVACLAAGALGSAAAAAGLILPVAAGAGSFLMLALGLLVAANLRVSAPAAIAVAAVVGLQHGYAGTLGEEAAARRPLLYGVGLLAGTGLLLLHVENIAMRARAFWMQIGMRVVGSWIAAIGLLIAMLSLLTPR